MLLCLLNNNSIWFKITVEGGINEKFIAPLSKKYSLEYKDKFVTGLKYVFVFVIIADEVGNSVNTLKLPVPDTIVVKIPVFG